MNKKNTQTTANVPTAVMESVALLMQRAEREARHTRVRIATAAMKRGEGIFQGSHDESGEPLDPAARDAIDRYLVEPTRERWKEVEGISVAGGGPTLGHWWTRVYPASQSGARPPHPAAADLRFLIEVAIAENLASAQARVR